MVTTTSAAPVELKSIIVWPSCFRLKNGQRIQRVIITGYGNNWNNPLWYLQTPVHFGYFVFTIICNKKLLKDNNMLFFLRRVTFQQLAIFFRVTCNVVHLSAQPNNFPKICQVGLFSVCKSALSPPHSLEIRKVF